MNIVNRINFILGEEMTSGTAAPASGGTLPGPATTRGDIALNLTKGNVTTIGGSVLRRRKKRKIKNAGRIVMNYDVQQM